MSDNNQTTNRSKLVFIVPVLLVLLVFVAFQTGLVSSLPMKQWLADGAATEGETTSTDNNWATAADGTLPRLDIDYVSMLLSNMSQDEREQLLNDPELFKQAIENEANNHSVLAAARDNQLHQDTNIKFLQQRGSENILREAYLNRLIATKLPQGFPSDSQLQEYYDNNQSRFMIPERIHVWQIFFQKPVDGDETAVKQVREQAEATYKQLTRDKQDFAELALKRSQHEQSRLNGGYMGLIKLPELLPEVREPLLELKQGQLSKPVESDSGFHILKRGERVAAETLELQQVENQIRQLLLRQAQLQLRTAIYAQAQKEYPQTVPGETIEDWRLQLQTSAATN